MSPGHPTARVTPAGPDGAAVRRTLPPPPLLARMLRRYRVDAILDVGAHVGQSGAAFRAMGFPGRIVSFEPVPAFHAELEARCAADPEWIAVRVALGAATGAADVRVSGGHGGASSLLDMTDHLRRFAPDQRVVRTERVRVETLDAMAERHAPDARRLFVKLDVQGAEPSVLAGGAATLERVVGLKTETSLVRSYRGETLLPEMLTHLYDLGFRLVAFEPGWSDPATGELFQVDAILFRTDRL